MTRAMLRLVTLLGIAGCNTPRLEAVQEGSGNRPQTLRGSKATVSAIAISADGAILAAASHDRVVRLWDGRTLRLIKTLNGHSDEVYDVAISPAGNVAASISYNSQLIFWSLPDGRLTRSMTLPSWATTIVFSPDGTRLAVPLQTGELQIINVRTGQTEKTFTGRSNAIAYSPDGNGLSWGVFAFATRNAATGDTVRAFSGHTGVVQSIDFSPNGRQAVSASRDYSARIWNTSTGAVEHVLEPEMPVRWRRAGQPVQRYKLPLSGARFSPDGRLVAVVGAGEIVTVWDAATGRLRNELYGESPAFTDVEFFPSGRRVAASGIDGGIRVWDVP